MMRGLDRICADSGGTHFDKVRFISGVAGGSVAAAYHGLRGRAALADFRQRFLIKNAEEDLNTGLNFVNLARGRRGRID
jgi:NTE family protein